MREYNENETTRGAITSPLSTSITHVDLLMLPWYYKEEALSDTSFHQEINQISMLGLTASINNQAKLYEQIYQKAEATEAFHIASLLADQLAVYALKLGDPQQYEKYTAQKRQYERLQTKYKQAFDLYRNVQRHTITSYDTMRRQATTIQQQLNTLKSLMEQTQIVKVGRLYCKAAATYYLRIGDYASLVKVADLVESLPLLLKSYDDHFFRQYVLFLRSTVYLYQRKTTEGPAFCKKHFKTYRTHQDFYFVLMRNHFLLFMQQEDYPTAAKVLNRVFRQQAFCETPPVVKESWYLYCAYLSLYTTTEETVDAFLNRELTILQKDKLCYQIHLYLVEVLDALKNQHWEAAEKAIQRLVKYRQKYLKVDYHRRTKLFVNLLRHLVNANFDYKQALKKTDYIRKELNQREKAPIKILIEIVPYDRLMIKVLDWYKAICSNSAYGT